MPDYPQLAYLSVQELIGAAGGDPWHIDDTLQAGAPGEISELAQSFYDAGVSMTQTSESQRGQKRFQAAWDGDDPAHPINDSVQVQHASQTMKSNREALTRVGVDLQHVAASLAETQRSGHISIGNLNSRLVQIDKTIAAEIPKAQVDGVALDWSALKTAAIDTTRYSLGDLTAVRNAYGSALGHARVEMAAEGYDPAPINGVVPNLPARQPNQQTGSQPSRLDDALNQIAGAPCPLRSLRRSPRRWIRRQSRRSRRRREKGSTAAACLPTRSNRG